MMQLSGDTIDRKVGIMTTLSFQCFLLFVWTAGGRLNKKDGLTMYGNSHVKDKMS